MKTDRARIDALDGLRALSAFSIFIYHSRLMPRLPGGNEGVTIFFVLSGFLITTMLDKEWSETGRLDLLHFYLRRALRLIPAAVFFFVGLLAVLFIFVFPPIVYGQVFLNGLDKADVGLAATLHFASVFNWAVNNDQTPATALTHLWTLSIEQQFYFVWPIALMGLLAIGRIWLTLSVVLTLALASLLSGLVMPGAPVLYIAYSTHTNAYALLFGCLAALIYVRTPGLRIPSAAVLLAFVALCIHFVHLIPNHEMDRLVTALCATIVVVGCADGRNLIARLLAVKPLVYLGARSYGFYLWHLPFVFWFSQLPTANQMISALVATLIMADLSYRLVERPALNWSKRIPATRDLPSLTGLLRGRWSPERSVEVSNLAPLAQSSR